MKTILDSMGDPRLPVGAGTIVFTSLMLVLVVRSADVRLTDIQKYRATRIVIGIGLSALLFLCGGVTLSHVPKASPLTVTHQALTSARHAGEPTARPSPEPSPTPTPSPTPQLTRSITQVLTTFCDALTSRDYQTAWQQYARRLQQAHSQRETFAVWRKFAHCSIPDQSADPSAWTILTLTLLDGQTDNRRIGDVDYRLTMTVESNVWKIAKVCQIMSEGCFPISWG